MTRISFCPDYAALEVAMDAWSEPFWQAGTEGRVVMPRCTACGTFRWPAGPFCPRCRAQPVEWVPPGQARVFSFTVLPVPGADRDAPPRWRMPTLVEFADAPGVRLVSVLVDADVDAVAIGDAVAIDWQPAANASVPVFRRVGR
ncbi:MAG: OB-fold domain-containing protein [Sphingomonadales bacterium]|nr:OB-fold domain-containing protein [Sphingomonadales bacterium]